jgi:hypothetical protein
VTDGQITNRDLYEAQRDTEKQLGGLALQVATLVAEWRGVGERLDSGSEKMKDLEARIRLLDARPAVPPDVEARIRLLEQFRWRMAGGSALAGALSGGGAATLIVYLLSRH